MPPNERVNQEKEEMKQGTPQRTEEFPDNGEEKSQGNICTAGLESKQTWETEGFRRVASEREKKMNCIHLLMGLTLLRIRNLGVGLQILMWKAEQTDQRVNYQLLVTEILCQKGIITIKHCVVLLFRNNQS